MRRSSSCFLNSTRLGIEKIEEFLEVFLGMKDDCDTQIFITTRDGNRRPQDALHLAFDIVILCRKCTGTNGSLPRCCGSCMSFTRCPYRALATNGRQRRIDIAIKVREQAAESLG